MPSTYPLTPESEEVRLAPGMRRVVVTTGSAEVVEDLASLRRDFHLASTFLDFYLDSDLEHDIATPSQIDALWIAAISLYGRGFASGRRLLAQANTDALDLKDKEEHDYFIDLRNKYIAHPVNGFERSTVFADLLDDSRGPAGIARVGEVHVSLSRISRERAETLQRLCLHHIDELTRRIESLHKEIALELQTLGQESVYGFADYVPNRLDGTNPRSSRK